MSIDVNTTAAKNFYKEVRKFALTRKAGDTALYYDTTPDEKYDITLVSRRAYGNPYETLAVMAACGLDSVDEELPQTRLTLPTLAQLYFFKRKTGFESNPEYRLDYSPTWAV
jgi:hypothetical protein